MTMNRIRRVPNYMMSFALFLIIFSRTEVKADSPDYVLALQASDSNRDAALLYCMDSHSYSRLQM